MRALPICLVALMLSGCSMLSRSPVEPVQSTAPQPKAEPAKPKAPRATPVRIYTNAEELVGKPFRDPVKSVAILAVPPIRTLRRAFQPHVSGCKSTPRK